MAAGGSISLAFQASSRELKPRGLALSISPSLSTSAGVRTGALLGRRHRRHRPGRPRRTRPGRRCLRPLLTMSTGPKRNAMPSSSWSGACSAQPSRMGEWARCYYLDDQRRLCCALPCATRHCPYNSACGRLIDVGRSLNDDTHSSHYRSRCYERYERY